MVMDSSYLLACGARATGLRYFLKLIIYYRSLHLSQNGLGIFEHQANRFTTHLSERPGPSAQFVLSRLPVLENRLNRDPNVDVASPNREDSAHLKTHDPQLFSTSLGMVTFTRAICVILVLRIV